MTEPRQKPGRSKQDYGTPPEFLSAAKRYLEIEAFDCDLAASAENAVCPIYVIKNTDALLLRSWRFGTGWNWLNPEYSDIAPWVEKAFNEARTGARTAVLIPASVGANWWRDWVHGKAMALLLNGRIKFVGAKDWYPKDCALLLYSPEYMACILNGDWPYDVWTWGKGATDPARIKALEEGTPIGSAT